MSETASLACSSLRRLLNKLDIKHGLRGWPAFIMNTECVDLMLA
jgi:hypothetical protein